MQSGMGRLIPGLHPGYVTERVQIDLNHPLAGKPIIFESEILSVEPPEEVPDNAE